ncbi:zf-HC2 domain-containing protein [Streptomyces sp. NPDC020412]|uniref:zf-HC2 domain-containing protein n=1 Tax=Streptomyces sp. NPDC020412 TaxID=3365073 RepID=UPI003796C6E6
MEDVVITPQRHEDVAAYALGVLEPADAHRFEDHLARCGRCRVQLSGFAATAGALRELAALGPAGVDTALPPPLPRPLVEEVRQARRRARLRRRKVVVAVLALAFAVLVGTYSARPPGKPAAAPRSAAGERLTAVDAGTGVMAWAAVSDRDWGTEVELRLAGLRGPAACRLVAVGRDGVVHPVLSWRVPPQGFGTGSPGGGPALEVQGGTNVPSWEIDRWEVRDDGTGRLLVTLHH